MMRWSARRSLLSAILWSAFAAIVGAIAFRLVPACGLSLSFIPAPLDFHWSSCPARPVVSPMIEHSLTLSTQAAQLELDIARRKLTCASIPPPEPPPLQLPDHPGPVRLQQAAECRTQPTIYGPESRVQYFCPNVQSTGGCARPTVADSHTLARRQFYLGSRPGRVQLTYEMYNVPDELTIVYRGREIAGTRGPITGNGKIEFSWAPARDDYSVDVIVRACCPVLWNYTMSCPG